MTYHTHDKVVTPSGSLATYQWTLGNGTCKIWIKRCDWQEKDPYPCKGEVAPVILDESSLKHYEGRK